MEVTELRLDAGTKLACLEQLKGTVRWIDSDLSWMYGVVTGGLC